MPVKKAPTKDKIISMYMSYVLENDNPPNSVYAFTKEHKFSEAEFYKLFSNFQSLEKTIFTTFLSNSIFTLKQSPDYQSFNAKEKLLGLYYTLIENLTVNRSFVLLALGNCNNLKNLSKLKAMRTEFLDFIDQLDFKTPELNEKRLDEIKDRAINEGFWLQLLVTLRFWMDDESVGFEKTDLFIEKSVNASLDLIDLSPLKNVVDFGKFLFKETIKTSS